ncbi:MAG TPA: prolyl oligopeptidase family serine peptidase [Pyrinomonadaceae bacterium]
MRKHCPVLLLVLLCCAQTVAAQTASSHAEYLGRYTDGADYVVYVEETAYGLTVRPALWTATQLLKQTGPNDFTVVDRTTRGAKFRRDARGRVAGVTIRGMEGEGLNLIRANQRPLPIELLLSGKGAQAAREYLAARADAKRIIESAERVLSRFPSKASAVVAFLSTVQRRDSRNANLHVLLGSAYVAVGNRTAAVASFRRAYALDPNNKDAVSGLARLHALPRNYTDRETPWRLRFPLHDVFKPPTAGEIKEVEKDWRSRDLRPRDVREVATGEIKFGEDVFRVRVVSHLVHGQKHFGAIMMPANGNLSSYPVIVEAKGVSWNYFHLNLTGLDAPAFMKDSRRQFIYVVPSFRGEVMNFNGVDYESEGDRTNAWDGATDDALALLNVALETTPAADPHRIGVFGRSRGGTVALLMAERDPRIRCVVEWAGPTDRFSLMGTEGWTQEELFAEGLRTRARPDETGGQRVEHFLLKAVRGEEGLTAVRHRLIASSPLYFARRLPPAQLHYGMEDTSVPVRNGVELAKSLRLRTVAKLNRAATARADLERTRAVVMQRGQFEAFFYRGQGHDTDRLLAPVLSRQFLIDCLAR